jgi:hypothetical protein
MHSPSKTLTPGLALVDPVRPGLAQAAFDLAQAKEACGLHPALGQLN